MNNYYVVIEGVRYDFKDISKITEDCCSVCALKNFCDIEDSPCSVFNPATNIFPHSPQYAFVKHVKTSNNGKEIIKNEDKITNEGIEYARTDAFIKRTEEYLYKQLNEGNMECGDIETFIEDYKKYMEG